MTALRITLCLNGTAPEPWQQGLSAALPEAVVSIWQPGMPQPAQADLAVVWAPPQAFIDEQTSLKALFNIGAGVDALLRLRLPPDLAVVRLDDAGMAVQMAEYVCHAVIRHFRELDVSEAEMAAGQWAFRKPRQRADFAVGVLGLGVLGTRVAQALRTFDTSYFQVPGRLNVYDELPFKVILDYGHNPAAVRAMVDLTKRLDVAGRRLCVLAAPGDRRNEEVTEMARIIGESKTFAHIFLKRDDDLRGRGPTEIPDLMRAALIASGYHEERITTIPDEREAVDAFLAGV